MLVTFKTNAFSDITLFGEPAVSLLKMMGQSGNVPGAIMAEEVPAALQALRAGLDQLSVTEQDTEGAAVSPDDADHSEDMPAPVALHKRAGPLVQLLEAASAAGDNVLWDK